MIMNLTAADLRKAANLKEQIERLKLELQNIFGVADQPEPENEYRHRLRPLPSRRRMSPQARAKIAAAARLRWRKAKSAGKNHL